MVLFETINIVSVVLFAVGMVLLLIELFVPGFGIFGGLGLVALVLCILFQARSLLEALILLVAFSAIVIALALIAGRSLHRGFLFRTPLVLKDAEDKENGYVSSSDYSHLVGETGISITPLRPAGLAELSGRKYDVVTEGEFIPARSRVRVDRVVGSRIIVRQLEDTK